MAVAFRAVTTAQGSDATAEGTIPTGTAAGDLMVAFLSQISTAATITGVPSGWTLQEDDPNPADFSLWCYTRPWQSGDTNPTWTIDRTGDWDLTIASYSGVDTTTPVNVDIGEVIAAANSLDLGPITPTVNDCMLVAYASVDASTAGAGRTWTTADMTQRVNESTFLTPHHRVLADRVLSGGSGVGQSQTCTVSGGVQDIGGFLLALTPAGTVIPTGIASSEAFGAPAVTGSLTVSPTGIASAEVFGTPTAASSSTAFPAPIASAEAFGTPVITATLTVTPVGIASGEAFGTPTRVLAAIHATLNGPALKPTPTLRGPGVRRVVTGAGVHAITGAGV